MAVHAQAIRTDEGVRLCLFDKFGWDTLTRLAAKGWAFQVQYASSACFPFEKRFLPPLFNLASHFAPLASGAAFAFVIPLRLL